MKKTFLSLILLIAVAILCFASNINGSWVGKFEAQFDVTLNVTTDGKKLKGTIQIADNNPISENPGETEYSPFIAAQLGENLIIDGKINGDEFSFNTDFNGVPIAYKGKIEAEKLVLTVNFKGQEIRTSLRKNSQ